MKENLYQALKTLADGQYHSGDKLGASMGVSRAAVWKQLQKLIEFGIDVESLKGKGYRIKGGLDLLDRDYILEQLSSTAQNHISELVLLDQVDSTNTYVLSRSNGSQGFSGLLCLSEQQTAGRGRRGREWFTSFATGLCFSLGKRFYGSAQVVEGLSLAVGLVLVEALESLGYKQLGLKWPNDVLSGGKKLAGVLIEMQGDLEGPVDVVIGIGLNVYGHHDERIDQDWISLEELAASRVSRNDILVAVLNKLVPLLADYENTGFIAYQQSWNSYDVFAGKPVRLMMGDKIVEGQCCGVDQSGALLLKKPGGELQAWPGGEISVRLNNDS